MPTHTFTHTGQTVTWTGGSGNYAAGPDGVLMIQRGGTPVTVTAYTPAWQPTPGYNGMLVGIPGDKTDPYFGIDYRMNITGVRTLLPAEIPFGESAIFIESKPADEIHQTPNESTQGTWIDGGPSPYHSNNSRSIVKHIAAIVVVAYDPTGAASTMLSPPVIGQSAPTAFLRKFAISSTLGIPAALLDYSKLPDTVDLTTVASNLGISVTAFDTLKTQLETIYANFMGDFISGWHTDEYTAGFQHPGYGTFMASCASQALVLLASSRYTPAQKATLAKPMAQAGLHLIGAWLSGRYNFANGGHSQGRKELVLLFAYLSGITAFAGLNDLARQTTGGDVFQEDSRFIGKQWFSGASPNIPWQHGWIFQDSVWSSPDGDDLLGVTPTSWGNVNDPSHSDFAWKFNAYFPPTVASVVGAALFFNLIGWERYYNVHLVGCVRQWMTDWNDITPSPVHAGLVSAGIDFTTSAIKWNDDYGYDPKITGMCAEAWRLYNVDTLEVDGGAPGQRPSTSDGG